MASYIEKTLTSKALNALWGIENSAKAKRMKRPRVWRPSHALIKSCSYELLLRIPCVGPGTANMIMKWKRKGGAG